MAKKKSTTPVSAPMPLTQYENLKLSQLRLSSMNPRKTFSDEAIRELSESIRHQGLLQPITVRPIADVVNQNNEQVYEIVCGARRYKAMLLIEAETVPSIIRDMTDAEALDAMIVENLQRKDVDPLEEAEAFRLLLDQGQSIADLALRFGKSERYVRDRCKLNDLVPELREAFHQNKLPLSGAIMLARLPQDKQVAFADDNDFAVDTEWESTQNVTINDVKDFIEYDLPSLNKVSFLSMPEEQWNIKKEPRLCSNCALNSSCQLSLFPELAESSVCGDPACHQRKREAFARWYMDHNKKDFIPAANGLLGIDLAPDDAMVVVMTDDKWDLDRLDEQERALYESLKEKYISKYLFVVNMRDGVRRCWGSGDTLDRMIQRREAVKGINLYSLVAGSLKCDWYTIPHVDRETEEDKLDKKVDALVTEYRGLDAKEKDSILNTAFEMFEEAELQRKDGLQWWERALMSGALITGLYETLPRLGENPDPSSFKQYMEWWANKPDYRQERESLVAYFKQNNRRTLLASLFETIDPAGFGKMRDEIKAGTDSRRREIEAELADLGYDVQGHRINETNEQ